jgi:MSHA biogenesis protein MshJ
MKRWWQAQAARIDALSLRERVFLFLSVMACCVALADVVWLSPARLAHQQLTQRFEKQSAELQRARETLKSVALPAQSSKGSRDEISAVKQRLDEVNLAIQEVLPTAPQATPLAQVLVHLLRRHEGLTLVHTMTLAPEAGVAKSASAAGTAPVGVARQGVELTVSGPYAELTRYVKTLEQAMPTVRWGSMTLKSEKPPPELTLQLFLVGVPP